MFRNIRLVVIGIGIASLSAGAQSAPPLPTITRIEATRVPRVTIGDVSEFVPAVAAIDSGGRCVETSRVGITDDQQMFAYAFDTDGKPTRRISVVIDSRNQLVRYSDLRGVLTRSSADMLAGIHPGVMTALSLNGVQGFAMIENKGLDENAPPMQIKPAAFLNAPNLGVPQNMIEHVLRECAR